MEAKYTNRYCQYFMPCILFLNLILKFLGRPYEPKRESNFDDDDEDYDDDYDYEEYEDDNEASQLSPLGIDPPVCAHYIL